MGRPPPKHALAPKPGSSGLRYSARDRRVIDALKGAKSMSGHCARHAVHHLDQAWRLKKRDPEMALLRAITAEEEAATALMIVVQEHRYDHAVQLRRAYRQHAYKQGLFPYLNAIRRHFALARSGLPQLLLGNERVRGTLRLFLLIRPPNGEAWLRTVPPLHLSLTEEKDARAYYFERETPAIAAAAGEKSVIDAIRALTKLRNYCLYASSRGMPRITSGVVEEIERRKTRVFFMLTVFCLIFPYREPAVFVQQALDGFLLMMGRIEKEALGAGFQGESPP